MARLTEQDARRFQRLLAKRREELRWLIHDALIESRHTDYIELAGAVHNSGEAAVANLLSEMNLSQLRREVEEIGDVEAALERIKHGSFGKCSDCATPSTASGWRPIPRPSAVSPARPSTRPPSAAGATPRQVYRGEIRDARCEKK